MCFYDFYCKFISFNGLNVFSNYFHLVNCIANLFIVFVMFLHISIDCNVFYVYFLRAVMYFLWILMFGQCLFNILICFKTFSQHFYGCNLILSIIMKCLFIFYANLWNFNVLPCISMAPYEFCAPLWILKYLPNMFADFQSCTIYSIHINAFFNSCRF